MSNSRIASARLALPAATLLAAAFFAASHLAAAESVATGKLDFVAKDFAFDPATGNVAATDPKQNTVSLYDADAVADGLPLKPVARVKVGDGPAWIACKDLGDKRLFVVGCLKDPAVYLLDAGDLKQVARIPVDAARCVGVTVTESNDDPYAYATFYLREGSAETRKIQLVKHADEGAKYDHSVPFVISPRGTYAYSSGPGRSWTLFQPAPPVGPARIDPRTMMVTRRAHGELIINHDETTAAIGETLFTPAFDRQIGTLPMEAAAFFAAKPIVVGFNGDEFDPESKDAAGPKPLMVFASTNDWKKIDEVVVPPALLLGRYGEDAATPEDEQYLLGGRPTRVFADDARSRVVAARNDQITVVKLAGAKLPDEPVLRVEIVGKVQIAPGRKNLIPLKAVDPRVKITLVDPVDDMKITPEGLEWTPAAGAVGERKVSIRLSAGALEKIQILQFRASLDELTLPFMADGVQLSADRSEAVVWSFPLTPRTTGDPIPNEPFSRVAIVNLHDGKVGLSAVLPHVVRRLAIDATNIYAAAGPTLAVIDRATLKVGRRVLLDSEIVALATIDDGKLLVCLADCRRIKYSLPDLRLETDYQAAMPQRRSFEFPDRDRKAPSISSLTDGLSFGDGDIFDRSFSRPLLLESIPLFLAINRPRSDSSPMRGERLQPTPTHHLSSGERQIIAVSECSEPDAVVALAFLSGARPSYIPSNVAISNPQGYSLEVYPPAAEPAAAPPTPDQIITLSTTAASLTTLREREPRGRGDFAVHEGVAYCVCGDKLVKARIPAPRAAASLPLAFKGRQSTIVLDRSAATRLTHSVVAPAGKQLEFKLVDPTPGLSVEKDGTVVVDGPQLAAFAVDYAGGPLAPQLRLFNPFTSVEKLDEYAAKVGPLFRQIAGRDPQGVPLAVAVHVEAAAAPEPSARLLYYTLLEIPREQITERLATLSARRAVAQAAAADPVKAAEHANALEQRLAALETELKRLTEEVAKRLEQ